MKRITTLAIMVFFTVSLSVFGWGWNSAIKNAKDTEVVPGAGITIEEFVGKFENRVNELSGEKATTVWSKVNNDGIEAIKIEIYQTKSKRVRETTIVLIMNEDHRVEYLKSGGILEEFQSYPVYIHNVAAQLLGDQDLARQAYMLMIN